MHKIRVGITMGDPSGIGPVITLKAIKILQDKAEFTVIGDKWVFDRAAGHRSEARGVKFLDLHNVAHKKFSFGKVRPEYGRASIEYLDKALDLIKDREIDCLVTCPISKEAISLAGFKYPGHTEYLAAKTNTKDFQMMLANEYLRFVLFTRHLPLREVPSRINKKSIYNAIFLTAKFLRRALLIKNPRIAVCGLNPHASDNGLIGEEENKVIKPALKKIRKELRLVVRGPFSADVAIYKAAKNEYDCVMAAYHDQALIPLKLLGNKTGVNVTMGLPFIRTSPLHGTAFDIAGNYILCDPGSLIEAIKLAIKCASNLKKV